MKKRNYLVITFSETTMALFMEKKCKENKMPGRIIPLPKEIDAGCGLAWASEDREQDMWKNYMETQQIEYEEMVEVEF
ncbi:MAG: DUF3343 domain-containing protein [Fusicatenibacter sp.]|nr:DUF3343 domain-containing protein [Lachnospiraceae bacterium]MDY2937717.1 DUF3343 domain-containing protein [Fusicatenibacter sp.]